MRKIPLAATALIALAVAALLAATQADARVTEAQSQGAVDCLNKHAYRGALYSAKQDRDDYHEGWEWCATGQLSGTPPAQNRE
jgi:hypothetical protein